MICSVSVVPERGMPNIKIGIVGLFLDMVTDLRKSVLKVSIKDLKKFISAAKSKGEIGRAHV